MGLSLVLVVAQRRVLVRELGELVGGVAVDGQPQVTCRTSVASAAVLWEPTYGVEYDGQSMVVCSTSVATGAAVLCTSTDGGAYDDQSAFAQRRALARVPTYGVASTASRQWWHSGVLVVARGLGELVGGVAFDGHPTVALSGRFCLCTSVCCCVHRQIRDRHPLRRRLGGGV